MYLCVKHANFTEKLLLSVFHNVKIKTSTFCVCINLERRREKRERNKQTEKHEVCKGYKICFCVFSSILSILTPSFLNVWLHEARYEKCHHRIRFQRSTFEDEIPKGIHTFAAASVKYEEEDHVLLFLLLCSVEKHLLLQQMWTHLNSKYLTL